MNNSASFDAVTLTVINNYLTSTCRDMGISMMRTSYSPIFNESLDFSCLLFDRDGLMIAQAEFCPSQIGTSKYTAEWVLEEIGKENFHAGDVLVVNDPYRGSGHVPEHTIIKPVFFDGELLAFVANCGHLAEPGAKSPGGLTGDATDIFQEGLRLPPVWLVRNNVDQEDVWKIILSNHRTPEASYGDLKAMIGSTKVAEERLWELVQTYGVGKFLGACNELQQISERQMREEIAKIPDGEYFSEDTIEDDGVDIRSYTLRCRVMVRGDSITIDFTGSDAQCRGPMNATYAVTASAVYNAVLNLTDSSIIKNDGCYRPIKVIAPPGTIVNCQYPAPVVGGNTELSPRITDLVLGALGQALPDRIPAAHGATSCNFLFGGVHPKTGEYYSHYHLEGVGWGGKPNGDGNSVTQAINGNCRNTPVEVFETRYPLRVESYRMVENSGGEGKFRGGMGGERVLTVLAPVMEVSALFNRTEMAPPGRMGGESGAPGGLWVKRKGDKEFRTFGEVFGTRSDSKFGNVFLVEGDQIKIASPGGGGWGDPNLREL